MVPCSLSGAWTAFEDTTPFSAFSSGCCVLSYTPTDDLEVMSLILVETFRYFYCSSFLNNNSNHHQFSLFEAYVIQSLPLFIESSNSPFLTSLFSEDFRFWSSVISPPLRHISMLSDFRIHKNCPCKPLLSEFLNILTSNVIVLYYISAKH